MALPDSNDLKNLQWTFEGQPFIQIEPSTNVDTSNIEWTLDAQPFMATGSGDGEVNLEELLYFVDTATSIPAFPSTDFSPLVDEIRIDGAVYLNELMYFDDSQALAISEEVTYSGTIVCQIKEQVSFSGTTRLDVLEAIDLQNQLLTNVLANNLVVVTNASSASNPTQPTLILGGNIVYSNPSTEPPPEFIANARCYVNFDCETSIDGISLADLFDWNLSLNDQGGTWSLSSETDLGWSRGSTHQIFGLTGTVTKTGRKKGSAAYAYTYSGIFGNRNLNKSISFIGLENAEYLEQIPGQTLDIPSLDKWKTYADFAAMIGAAAGAGVQYLLNDISLVDITSFVGQSGISALASIAEQAGGMLRWNGGQAYVLASPIRQFGQFTIPDCCLIQNLEEECQLDLATGIYSPGVYIFNQYKRFNPGTFSLPTTSSNGGGNTVTNPAATNEFLTEDLITVTKKMTQQDPPLFVDLPDDFVSLFIQVVTVTDGGGQFVTTNPNKQFLLQSGFAGSHINSNDIGGVLKKQAKIDWSLFPQDNTDVNAGHFYLKLSVVRSNLGGDFDQAKEEEDSGKTKANLARTQNRYRFIPVCTVGLTTIFSGAMPLPGMNLSGELGDMSIDDYTIESVTFTNPGILNIQAVKWAELDFLAPIDTMGTNP